jgi:hypothetical protein
LVPPYPGYFDEDLQVLSVRVASTEMEIEYGLTYKVQCLVPEKFAELEPDPQSNFRISILWKVAQWHKCSACQELAANAKTPY